MYFKFTYIYNIYVYGKKPGRQPNNNTYGVKFVGWKKKAENVIVIFIKIVKIAKNVEIVNKFIEYFETIVKNCRKKCKYWERKNLKK